MHRSGSATPAPDDLTVARPLARALAMDSSQMIKGVLDVAVLAVVERGDAYGYEIVRKLREGGLDDVGDASVYGTLRRLFSAGALTSYVVPSDEGPYRKYYGLNKAGQDLLERSRKTWRSFADTMDRVLGFDGAEEAA